MKTRMEKYNSKQTEAPQRSAKNEELYSKMHEEELDDYKVSSNSEVLGKASKNINIEQIRDILQHKYNEAPKRRSIAVEDIIEEEYEPESELEKTKEYDINTILEKKRSEKVTDYDTDRLKKLRDTQYNILKSLDLEKLRKPETSELEEPTGPESELMDLINTITQREDQLKDRTKSEVALDILEDLKGNEHTQIIEGLGTQETEIEEFNITNIEEKAKDIKKKEKKADIDKSFYTNSVNFTQSDFDDFNDLKNEVKSSKILIKILIGLIVLILVVGIIILLNSVLNLGWF